MERRERPGLPGSTPSKLVNERLPYANPSKAFNTLPPPPLPKDHGNYSSNSSIVSNGDRSLSTLSSDRSVGTLKILKKTINTLPFEMRESVGSAVDLVIQQNEIIRNDLNNCTLDLAILRSEIKKKNSEIEHLTKQSEISQRQISDLENTLKDMQDNLEQRQHNLVKNRKCINRMAGTNRMLIDSLDALESNRSKYIAEKERQNEGKFDEGGNINEKLKESLLRTSREHYRHTKQIEVLEASVETLKLALKKSEARNRHLQLNLDELQSSQEEAVSSPAPASNMPPPPGPSSHRSTGRHADADKPIPKPSPVSHSHDNGREVGAAARTQRNRHFGRLDESFQELISQNHIEISDALLQMRRLYSYLSCAPVKHNVDDAVKYLVSREAMKIFNAEQIIVYLIPHYNNDRVFHKHTLLNDCQVFDLTSSSSIATDVIHKNQFFRLNSLHGRTPSNFNSEIDGGGPNIVVKRIICAPLYDAASNRTIGAITLLNKSNGDVFTEVDDLFAEMFAEHATTYIVTCYEFERVNIRGRMLSTLLEASTDIFDVLPDQDAEYATVLPGSVLLTLERIAYNVLRCTKVKAFLCTSALNMPGDELIILEKHAFINAHRKPPTVRRQTANEIVHVENGVGFVGRAIKAKKWILLDGDELDMAINASVDMESVGQPMISVPILNAENTVLACLQLVAGPQSPKFEADLDGISQDNVTICFEQALQWFLHQISHPLEFLCKYAGKPIQRPLSTPKPLKDVKGQRIRHSLSMRREISSPNIGLVSMSSFFGMSSSASSSNLLPSSSFHGVKGERAMTPNRTVTPSKLNAQLRSLSEAVDEIITLGDVAVNQQFLSTSQQSELTTARARVGDITKALLMVTELQVNNGPGGGNDVDFLNLDAPKSTHSTDERSVLNSITVVREESGTETEPAAVATDELIANLRRELEDKYEFEMSEQLVRKDQEHADIVQQLNEKYAALQIKLKTSTKQDANTQQLESKLAAAEKEALQWQERVKALQGEVTVITSHASKYESDNNELLERQKQLIAKLEEKDKVLEILQNQLVQMAESNLNDLDVLARRGLQSSGSIGMNSPPMSAGVGPTDKSGKDSSALLRAKSESNRPPPISSGKSPMRTPAKPSSTPTLATGTEDRPYSVGQFAPGSFDSTCDTMGNKLPVNWAAYLDDNGTVYYYNDITGESSWESPTRLEATAEGKEDAGTKQSSVTFKDENVIIGDWQQQRDETGQEYWVNIKTGASEWSLPDSAQQTAYVGSGVTPKGTKYDSYKIEL